MALSPRLLRPRASGVAFDPRSISGALLWLNASDATSLTLDGTAVTAWASRVGSLSVTQSVVNNAPAYASSVSGLNNNPALLFDGSNDVLLNTSSGLLDANQSATILIAHRIGTATGNRVVFDIAQGAGPGNAIGGLKRFLTSQSYNTSLAPYFATSQRDFVFGNSLSAADTSYVHCIAFDAAVNSSATNPLYYRNGVGSARTVLVGSDGSMASTPTRFSVGNGSQGASEFYSGHLAEILVYGRVLSDGERLAIERYYGAKYGISVA